MLLELCPYGFLMLSGGRERVPWEQMGWKIFLTNTLGIFNMNIALTTVNILIYKGNYDIFLTEAFNMVVCISNNNDLSIY